MVSAKSESINPTPKPALSIRRLGPGDEAIVRLLALEEPDFDLDGRGSPLAPLTPEAVARYLANPAVVHWIAFAGKEVVGHLNCLLLPLRADIEQELLLYEIGVRSAWRRQGTGRALMAEMEAWMQANGVREVWVGADNRAAVAFYRACDFETEDEQPVYMSRQLAES